MRILGIETSCDETAAAVVEDGKRLLSNVVASSIDLHVAYGGVVPEIAARSHIESIIPVIEEAVRNAFDKSLVTSRQPSAKTKQTIAPKRLTTGDWRLETQSDPWDQIDGIAVTYGAGLGGSLLIGVLTARTLALIKNKPLYAVNHVEGHVYANFLVEDARHRSEEREVRRKENPKLQPSSLLTPHSALLSPILSLPVAQPQFPMLALIVSGGHSQLVLFRNHFDYTLLGQTRDDAIGEAFDKVAKILGLPYPGGPSISRAAESGNPYAYALPKAKLASASPALTELRSEERGVRRGENSAAALLTSHSAVLSPRSDSYDFSFSGLKTAVLRLAQAEVGESFDFPSSKLPERLSEAQKTNIAASFQRVAIETLVDKTIAAYEEFQPASVVIAGGVAANSELRRQLSERLPCPIEYTDIKLCTDNGAMIATLGCYKALYDQSRADPYSLAIEPNLSM